MADGITMDDQQWEQSLLDRSKYLKKRTLEGLFSCPFFFGELSRENAIEILNEALKNDGESEFKSILFLETVSDDIGQNRFALIEAWGRKGPNDSQPLIYFNEISHSWPFHYCICEKNLNWGIVTKNPFSLEVLAAVKVASCGFNLETLGLPRMIKEEVKKYQDLNERIKSFD